MPSGVTELEWASKEGHASIATSMNLDGHVISGLVKGVIA